MTPRVALALVVAGLVAALGALMLGEYEFTGGLPFMVGPLFGLAIGEVVAAIGRAKTVLVGALTGAVCFGGMMWIGWIDSSNGVEPLHPVIWPSAGLAAVAGYLRIAGLPRRRSTPG